MLMEWYILDDFLRRETVIEGFSSFIWTERYAAWGDFEVIFPSTYPNRSMFRKGIRIGKKNSDYVMTIETISDSVTPEGERKLTVTGRSLEAILDDRAGMPLMQGTAIAPQWVITDAPADVMRYMFDQVCVAGVLSPNDTIPFYHAGTFLPAGTLPEPSDTVTIAFDPDSLYNDFKKVCEIWPLGFRLVKKGDLGEVYFDVYTGDDRTTAQTDRPPVIFSLDLESIKNTDLLRSTALLKNVAYVFAQNGSMMVYATGYDSSVSGSDRKVLVIKADDIDLPAGSELDLAMTRKGMEELAKNREIYSLDGEIPQYLPYIYGIDYKLGDLVETRNEEGYADFMLVTEHISIRDAEGERSYPTLSFNQVIVPGTWLARPGTQHWDDVDIEEHWADL